MKNVTMFMLGEVIVWMSVFGIVVVLTGDEGIALAISVLSSFFVFGIALVVDSFIEEED